MKKAMSEFYNIISEQQTAHHDASFIVAGDFNQASLNSVLPNFYQYINFATRGDNTLDLVYTNINSHRATPSPTLATLTTYSSCYTNTIVQS